MFPIVVNSYCIHKIVVSNNVDKIVLINMNQKMVVPVLKNALIRLVEGSVLRNVIMVHMLN